MTPGDAPNLCSGWQYLVDCGSVLLWMTHTLCGGMTAAQLDFVCPPSDQQVDLKPAFQLAQALLKASEEALQNSIAWFDEHLKA